MTIVTLTNGRWIGKTRVADLAPMVLARVSIVLRCLTHSPARAWFLLAASPGSGSMMRPAVPGVTCLSSISWDSHQVKNSLAAPDGPLLLWVFPRCILELQKASEPSGDAPGRL